MYVYIYNLIHTHSLSLTHTHTAHTHTHGTHKHTGEMAKDAEGRVKISVIASFKRMRILSTKLNHYTKLNYYIASFKRMRILSTISI